MISSTFTVIVPVLKRPERVRPLTESFLAAGGPNDADLLFVCQEDDTDEVSAVRMECERSPAHMLIVPREKQSWAKKINAGLQETRTPWLLCGADDIAFLPGWTERIKPFLIPGTVVGSFDGLNSETANGTLATHPLVSRTYAEVFGTIDEKNAICHEGYIHNYVDNEITLTAKMRGRFVFSPERILDHAGHFLRDATKMDDVYRIGLESAAMDQMTYHRRLTAILRG